MQLLLYACFFFAETYWSLQHIRHLSHSSIKVVATVFTTLYFQTLWPNWLQVKKFGLWLKIISLC